MKHNLGWTEWAPWRSKGETRIVAAEAQLKLPLKWDREAKAAGERHRVFCAPLADVFEDWQGPMLSSNGYQCFQCDNCVEPDGRFYWDTAKPLDNNRYYEHACGECLRPLTMSDVRARLFQLIDATPNLDWLLLTKRPENIARMMPWARRGETRMEPAQRKNIWLGTSVENQQTANERIPHLLKNSAAVRFLSVEPLLGPIDLRTLSHQTQGYASFGNFWDYNCENHCPWRGFESELIADPEQSKADADRNGVRYVCPKCQSDSALIERRDDDPAINWVIIGGPGARPCNVEWIRDLVRQCKAAGVPVFIKQLGAFADMAEWPEDLRVREFPTPQRSA